MDDFSTPGQNNSFGLPPSPSNFIGSFLLSFFRSLFITDKISCCQHPERGHSLRQRRPSCSKTIGYTSLSAQAGAPGSSQPPCRPLWMLPTSIWVLSPLLRHLEFTTSSTQTRYRLKPPSPRPSKQGFGTLVMWYFSSPLCILILPNSTHVISADRPPGAWGDLLCRAARKKCHRWFSLWSFRSQKTRTGRCVLKRKKVPKRKQTLILRHGGQEKHFYNFKNMKKKPKKKGKDNK